MGIEFLTGQRLTADLLNTNIIAFDPQTYSKSVATNRASTTTLADDPELSGIPLTPGTWDIELMGFFTTASTTPALKTQWAFTGSWSAGAIRHVIGPARTNTVEADVITVSNMRGRPLVGQDSEYNKATGGAYGSFRETCRMVVVTVAGNLSLQWAQITSNASNISMMPGSNFTIRKISN